MCATIMIVMKGVTYPVARMLKKVSFPVDLNKFIGKMFAFKIEITTYNMTNFDEMYLLQT
ncbi:hypothetical protein Hanom_Chr07g00676571 [Helianthus anomalus]